MSRLMKLLAALALVLYIWIIYFVEHRVSKRLGTMLMTVGKEQDMNEDANGSKKYAYVFYATSREHICYSLVNIQHMIHNYSIKPDIDFVLILIRNGQSSEFCIENCFGPRVKLLTVEPPLGLSTNSYYRFCYVKLFAFSLYENYSRIVFLDSDGLVLRNMDHLFSYDLRPFNVGISFAYWYTKWLTSIFFVADLSGGLWSNVSQYLDRANLSVIERWVGRSAFDMEVLNFVFKEGNLSKVMPPNYARLDDYFRDARHEDDWNETYYVHFSTRKPFYYRMRAKEYMNAKLLGASTASYRNIFEMFWSGVRKVCFR